MHGIAVLGNDRVSVYIDDVVVAQVGAGRKPLPKAQRRSYKVLVSLSPAEAAAIRAAAAGEPLATWISEAALRRAARRGKR